MEQIKVKGKGITPLVRKIRVRVEDSDRPGLSPYDHASLRGQEFDVIAIGMHPYDDRTATAVAFLDTPDGIKELALDRMTVVSAEY